MPDINIPFEQVSIDLDAQDKFIVSNGIKMQHYRSIPCPVGTTDVMDSRGGHEAHPNCSNGHIYEFAGTVTPLFTSNPASMQLTDLGLLDGSVVNVTFPRYYDDGKTEIYIQSFDRFYICDCVVLSIGSQKVEAHITGLDKVNYNAVSIESIYDENGIKYADGDYAVVDGKIKWVGKRPGFNQELNRGVIYSVRYRYTPFYYVNRLMHEIRIINKIDFKTQKKTSQRAPYQAHLAREYYMFKEDKKDDASATNRQVIQPRDSVFGPR
jgi:hypothetical protein